MAKLAILAFLLVAVLAIADAHTTITTVIEENISRQERREMQCREDVKEVQFRQCQTYLKMGRNPEEEYMMDCCEEVSRVMPECRCDAIQQALKMAQKTSQSYQGKGMEEMMYSAMNLPRMCNWEQPTECQIKAVFV